MKMILLMLLLSVSLENIVNKSDQCKYCSDLLQAQDCNTKSGCQWESKGCIPSPETVVQKYNSFCETIKTSKCSKTIGCAFLDNQCTLFTGCAAYSSSSTSECYSISSKCISDGTTCIDAQECNKYNQTQCQKLPNNFDKDCIWDDEGCRDLTCADADATFNSDKYCNEFHSGCITTGAGCTTSPLQACSTFQGTESTCSQMTGSDGKCELNAVTGYCMARECENAPKNLQSDQECNNYQKGCLTSGKGCVQVLQPCSKYNINDIIECIGYIGTDGICEGDLDSNKCTSRQCQNGFGTTDQACNNYQNGCVTNGKGCVAYKLQCSNYEGTFKTCFGLIGIDGNCKGTSDKNRACTLLDCVTDSLYSYTTDQQCQTIQSWCITTGMGCVKTLQPCSSYSSTECNKLIGSDGNCEQGNQGMCAPKICTDASFTLDTNQSCAMYSKGCVTTGAGCIAQTTCDNTVSQITCNGTKQGSLPCNWSQFCIDNSSCSKLNTKSLCQNNLADNEVLCIWDYSQQKCREAECSDFTGTDYQTDVQCENVISGCVTNGIGCVYPNICSVFQGTRDTCLNFKAYCTNTYEANESSACISRSCSDQGLTFTSDYDCNTYLPTCLTNGNGCIINTALCSDYMGTQIQCDQFYGYDDNIIQGTRCWNNESVNGECFIKQCYHAQQMTSDEQCHNFLNGCIYNGNNSCLQINDPCTLYFGQSTSDCQKFIGSKGIQQCWWVSGSNCVEKQCTQNYSATNDQECNQFLAGCLTTGNGCIHESQSCESYSGTVQQCNNFKGNGIKCTRLEICSSRQCMDKQDAYSNDDCMKYHQDCRLQFGTRQCIHAQSVCTGYTLMTSYPYDIQSYCNQITLSDQITYCAYDPIITTNCVERKCSLWNYASQTQCQNYLGPKTCIHSNQYNNDNCYSLGPCEQYIFPSQTYSNYQKELFCQNLYDNSDPPKKCIFEFANNRCKTLLNCEEITSDLVNFVGICQSDVSYLNCQFDQTCFSMQMCTSYLIPSDEWLKQDFCQRKKQSYDEVITPCKYVAGAAACDVATCTDLFASSQTECDKQLKGCKYFNWRCYQIQPCYEYSVSYSDAEQNRIFCQNMYSQGSTNFCSYNDGSSTCSDPIVNCDQYSNLTPGDEKYYCNIRRDQTGVVCMYDPSLPNCVRAQNNDICLQVPTKNDWFGNICDLRTLIGYCTYDYFQHICQIKPDNCMGYSVAGQNDSGKIQNCQSFKDRFGNYCTWRDQSSCESAPDDCSGWTVPILKQGMTFCNQRIAKDGTQCTFDQGSSQCRNGILCEFINYSPSQFQCDSISFGCTLYQSKCYKKGQTCKFYAATSSNDDYNLQYCSGMVSQDDSQCTFLYGSDACTDMTSCQSYLLENIKDDYKKLACQKAVTKNGDHCNYWLGNCNSEECQNLLSKCYTLKACSAYITNGINAIYICSGYQDYYTKEYCTATYDSDITCRARTCDDIMFSTHEQCKQYMSTCKSNGIKCINATATCQSQVGNSDYCKWALDTNNVSKCINSVQSLSIVQCQNRTCDQNVVATSDQACSTYLAGCVTKGVGCISQSEPCSSYYGTTWTCRNFTGNGVTCWSDSLTLSINCRNRVCADNTTATTNSDCQSFLSGCLTNGNGCIDISEPCSSYSGNQEKCKNFKGLNQQYYCWNNSNVTSACRNRECSDLAASSDQECKAFMPSQTDIPQCITNGIKCVTYPQNCSNFKGTYDTCSQFTAQDGPCKATSYSLNPSNCTPRICSEAPKSYSTDEQCQIYHPSCQTTGRGCTSELKCSNIETNSACQLNIGCIWASQCKISAIDCSSLTKYGQSACVNNGTKCAWANNICRSQTCSDYDESLHSHLACNNLDKTCTTKGAGCITLGICSSYVIPSICNNANTTEQSGRCFWDNSVCRQRKCQDFAGKTNQICDAFLSGCKSSGSFCIGKVYDCTVFNGNKELCFQDSDGNVCIYLNGSCQKYTSCEDIFYNDFDTCQSVSKQCVPYYQYCISVRPCEQYENSLSCTIGINNTVCGWLPSGVCQEFKSCEDLIGTSSYDCQNYNKDCVSDSFKCIKKVTCAEYQNGAACYNIGTDGYCQWDSQNYACRQRKCEDKDGITDQECQLFPISNGKCTTDGTKCIPRQNCSLYPTKELCTFGLDGVACLFIQPLGVEKGYCREMECKDLTSTQYDECLGHESIKKQCVYNGKACEPKNLCANYTTQTACNKGGYDGVCAFFNGACQIFTKCEEAINKQELCNSRSDACFWEQSTQNCIPLTCEKTTKCSPVPSFDGKSFIICAFSNGICQSVHPSTLDSVNCYKSSAYTFTWDPSSSKCVSCSKQTQPIQVTYDIISIHQLFLAISILIWSLV